MGPRGRNPNIHASVFQPGFRRRGLVVDLDGPLATVEARYRSRNLWNLLVGVTGFEPATPTSRT